MKKTYISKSPALKVKIVRAKTKIVDGRSIVEDNGKMVRFNGGVYVTDDAEEIKLLEKTKAFKADFWDITDKESVKKKGAVEIVEGTISAPVALGAEELERIKETQEAQSKLAAELNQQAKSLAEREKALKAAEEAAKIPAPTEPKKRGRKAK